MSATFPDKFKEELSFLNATELLSKDEVRKIYSSKRRTKSAFIHDQIINYSRDIIKAYKDGKNILVVLNTVKRAQEFYKNLLDIIPEKDIELFHSRYIIQHKWEKEKKVIKNHPRVLIATQVVEVSLDIDYDVLYTEAAYLDSIIQRMGRVNRKGLKTFVDYNIKIFEPENYHPYNKDFMEIALSILEGINRVNSELDYLNLTNKFYNKIWSDIKREEENRYKKIWKELSYLYSINFSNEQMQKLLKTRSGIINIPAIPYSYKPYIEEINAKLEDIKIDLKGGNDSEYTNRKKMELLEEKKSYLVNVPIFYKKYLQIDPLYGDYYVVLEYDKKLGLTDEFDKMI